METRSSLRIVPLNRVKHAEGAAQALALAWGCAVALEREDVQSRLWRTHQHGFVAVSGDSVVGVVFYAERFGDYTITKLGVMPAYQRRGVGTALVNAAEEELKSLGAERILIWVRDAAPESTRLFWTARGYALKSVMHYWECSWERVL